MAQQEIELNREKKLRLEAELKNEINYQQNLSMGYPPLKKIVVDLEREIETLNQDFSSSDNAVKKIPKKDLKNIERKRDNGNNYSPTKVKARNFLTNVSYCRVKESDFDNRSFVVDCYTFILLNLNLFYLERKFENVFELEYVEILWNMLIPNSFYSFVCQVDRSLQFT